MAFISFDLFLFIFLCWSFSQLVHKMQENEKIFIFIHKLVASKTQEEQKIF